MKKSQREPEFLTGKLDTPMLNYSVYYFSATERILYSLLLFIGGAAVGLAFYGGLFKEGGNPTSATRISNIVVMILAGAVSVKVFYKSVNQHLKEKRAGALSDQFRSLLDSINTSLSSGSTMNDAFINAPKSLLNQYGEQAYIIKELNEIIAGLHNGLTLEEMISDFAARSDNEDIQNFANVVENCYRMGGDFKSVVRTTKDIITDKMTVSAEIATKVSSNKLQHTAMCVIPIILVTMLKTMSSMFAENLATPIGVIATTIVVGIITASYFWGKKIINIK